MRPPRYPFLFLLILFSITGCEKETSLELHQPDIENANIFKGIVTNHKFQLSAFYSDIPIDYVETDSVVKEETNLWGYVSGYLKDDLNLFTDNKEVFIEQNNIKIPGQDSSVLCRTYFIGADEDGTFMRFLDYQYTPFKYRLHEFHADYFILAIAWRQGATLYSRFDKKS